MVIILMNRLYILIYNFFEFEDILNNLHKLGGALY